jgi:S1-C subfamily serine protease
VKKDPDSLSVALVGPDDLGGKVPFSRSHAEVGAIERVRKSLFLMGASPHAEGEPTRFGTGFLLRSHDAKNCALVVTAAHVVAGQRNVQINLDGTVQWLPAKEFVATTAGSDEEHADIAVVRTESVPDGALPAPVMFRQSGKPSILAPGTEVLYGGYPLCAAEDADGRRKSMFARGMISGFVIKQMRNGARYPRYVLDGMVNAGMSGGPVFCPDTGVVAGIITGNYSPSGYGG